MKAVQRDFLPLGVSCHKGIGQRQTGIIVNEISNSYGSFMGDVKIKLYKIMPETPKMKLFFFF